MHPKPESAPVPAAWTTLAHIVRPQGRKGEVLADLLTDFPDTLTKGRALFLAASSGGEQQLPRSVEVTGMWFPHGRNQGRVVLALAGIESISDAERVSGCDLVVRAADRVPLADDSFYISDLVGSRLISRGQSIGTVTDVSFPTSPDGRRRLAEAAPLLGVEPAPREASDISPAPPTEELLIPFVRQYLVRVDPAARTIEMDLPDGLADLTSGSVDAQVDGADEPSA